MKRRGFFGALLGVAAVPIAAKAATAATAVEKEVVAEPVYRVDKVALGSLGDDIGFSCMAMCSTTAPFSTSDYDYSDDEDEDYEDDER